MLELDGACTPFVQSLFTPILQPETRKEDPTLLAYGCEEDGFQGLARLAYRDFCFEEREVFSKIEPPHTGVILFAREF